MRPLVIVLLACLALASSTPIGSGDGDDVSEAADVTSADGDGGSDDAAAGGEAMSRDGDGGSDADVMSADEGSAAVPPGDAGSTDDATAGGDATSGDEDGGSEEAVTSADEGDDAMSESDAGSADDAGAGGDVASGEEDGDSGADVASVDEGSAPGAPVPGDDAMAEASGSTDDAAADESADSAASGSGDDSGSDDQGRRRRRAAEEEEGSGTETTSGDGGDVTEGESGEGADEVVPKGVFVPPVYDKDQAAVVNKGVVHEPEEEEIGGNEHEGEAEAEVQKEEEQKEQLRKYLKARKKDKSLPPPENSEYPDIDINKIMKEEGQAVQDEGKTGKGKSEASEEENDEAEDAGDASEEEGGRRRRSLRRKRFLEADKAWAKGIIPYVFTSQITEADKPGIQVAMDVIEKNTCIRFKEKTATTRQDYGLDHDGFLMFIKASGCWAVQGNTKSPKGQKVSCCGWTVCIHELGHAMGAYHEHQSPLRQGLLSVNWKGIQPNYVQWYAKSLAKNIIVDGYDSQSIMSYQPWSFARRGMRTMDSLLPHEIRFGENTFYLFREVSKSHKCQELHCADSTMECVNDGYVTLIKGKCACACPYGLDPKKGCAEIEKTVPKVSKWPKGQFALDAPVGADCPEGFKKGSRKHFSGPGTWRQGGHVGSEIGWNFIKNEYCVKDDGEGEGDWEKGKYCILRKGGKCPKGFQEGSITWDDNPTAGKNEKTEPLPDGQYGEDTKVEFCCRQDGFPTEPMMLPNTAPLVLYPIGDCQPIVGMAAVREFYAFKNAGKGTAATSGVVPFIGNWWNSYYLYYCYYEPIKKDCGGIIELSASKPTVEITSPGFEKGVYPRNVECDWLVKGPPNSTLLLEFEEFQVQQRGTDCPDSLELRLDRLGQKGERFCGEGGIEESFRTLHETLMLTLRTDGSNQKKGFKAKVKIVLPEDHCFKVEDKGRSYRGTANFTRDFKACVEWRLVAHCDNNLWNDPENMLDGNYCRNPSDDLRPWCYTQIENCQRSYCDVCGLERPYDSLDDCPSLKTKGFCELNKREALDGCALSCADTLGLPIKAKKAADVTCPKPKVPADAMMTSGGSGPFKVGDSVTLKCKTGDQTFQQTCLTNGQWTPVGYVCGGCPEGWQTAENGCYHFMPTLMKGKEARAYCDKMGATLPMAKTAEQIDFLDSIRPPSTNVWLGATDEDKEGTWVFLDGSPADSLPWSKNEPNNYFNQDCARLNPKKTVDDVYCDSKWARFAVICSKPVGEWKVCADRREDCASLLEVSPRMCEEHPDFSKVNCRDTCGVCDPDSTPQCSVPPAGANMRLLTEASSLRRGQAATYECDEGYVVTKGSLNRACSKTGSLTGAAPQCTEEDKAITSVDPGNVIDRKLTGKANYIYSGNNDNFRISRSGRVLAWHFYSKQPRLMAFLVLRPQSDLPNTVMEVVGVNKYMAKGDRVNHIWKVPEHEQIPVENGDVVAVWYGPGKGGVPFDDVDPDENPEAAGVMAAAEPTTDPTTLPHGAPVPFNPDTSAKIFSFRAVVGPAGGKGPLDLTKFEAGSISANHALLATEVPEVEDTQEEEPEEVAGR